MANLNIETKTTHYVDAFDLEAFIKDLYGIDYSIVAAEEAGNDTSLTYEVTGKVESYDKADLDDLLRGKLISYRTGALLNLMAWHHKIPTGSYVIRICW